MPRSTASPLSRPSQASAATPRHQPASPSRQSRVRLASHTSVPGIITLPQAKQFDHHSSSRSSSPARSSRHSSQPPPPHPEPTTQDKPADLVNAPRTGQGKRRNREKRTDSPLKQAAEPELAPVQADALSPAANVATPDSPTKASRKRRGGRAARQPSPPMPPTADGNLFATPPQPPSHSRSLPVDTRSAHYNALPQEEDEWDMPTVAGRNAGQQEQEHAAKPKESLSWQQELLRSGSNNLLNTTTRTGNNGSPISRPRSRGQATKETRSAPTTAAAGRNRPALTTSHSESFASSSANSSLNWQQELLLRTDEVQLVQQVTTTTTVTSNGTPARQRRNQIKDSITFGLANLDLAESDVFSASPVAPASARRQQQKRAAAAPQVVETLAATPTKSVEPRYAGPTFHNSPAPSALPMPSFMLRRHQAETVITN
ncbi:hypothetical protein JCM10908_004552 [Rhodotorula pacifica]|uniref:uncharacterized protein n=1 Tax=Rhodotorula pacifica TaxID=1495444 RepID=UPI0031829F35